jgi:hypothetical protein
MRTEKLREGIEGKGRTKKATQRGQEGSFKFKVSQEKP